MSDPTTPADMPSYLWPEQVPAAYRAVYQQAYAAASERRPGFWDRLWARLGR